jgi:integrase
MARRAWGSGSLYRRESDGRWIGRVSDGRGGHRYVTGRDRDKVRARLRGLSRSSATPPARETVGEVIQRWIDGAKHLRHRTRVDYERLFALHIDPAVGRIPVSDLRPQDVERMVNDILARRSAQTAKHAHKLVRASLSQAVRWGLVERNVASLVKSPTVTRRPYVALTAEQTRYLLDATRGESLWPLWALAATTGMRQAELLGLRWQDVTATTATVNVTLRKIPREQSWALEEPKTERSRRTLPLSPLGIESLRKQKEQATSALWVFARADGRAHDRARVTWLFQEALSRHGLPRVRFHDLRHGAAHMMLDALGGDIRAVSSYLGHSTIGTTVDIYGGRADEARQRAADAIGRALEGNG